MSVSFATAVNCRMPPNRLCCIIVSSEKFWACRFIRKKKDGYVHTVCWKKAWRIAEHSLHLSCHGCGWPSQRFWWWTWRCCVNSKLDVSFYSELFFNWNTLDLPYILWKSLYEFSSITFLETSALSSVISEVDVGKSELTKNRRGIFARLESNRAVSSLAVTPWKLWKLDVEKLLHRLTHIHVVKWFGDLVVRWAEAAERRSRKQLENSAALTRLL